MKNRLKPKTYKLKPNRGFSLVELMVTISIFVMITSITLTNYPRFSNKLSLDLLAQDVALSLRQAQIFGSSVLGTKSVAGQKRIFGAYGIHFQEPNSVSAPDSRYLYLLFADIIQPNIIRAYDGPATSNPDITCPEPTLSDPGFDGNPNECLQKFLITGRNKIVLLCKDFIASGDVGDRVKNCKNTENKKISFLDIIFVRPNLDAKFVVDGAESSVSNVGIILESPLGEYNKTIVVWKTGQISVE